MTKKELMEWFKKNVKYDYYTNPKWKNPIEEGKKRLNFNCSDKVEE